MSIPVGLSATKTGFDLIKSAVELLKRENVDVHEVQARLIELQGLMLDARAALVDAEEENRSLKREIEEYIKQRQLAEDMEFQIDGGFYVRSSEVEKGLIAYCPVCWRKDGHTVPLETSDTPGYFRCWVHKSVYKTAAYRQHEKNRTTSAQRLPRSGGPGSWMG
jgi:hypothetical protein